eukprot:c35297_g1_i1 orf=284-973(+)
MNYLREFPPLGDKMDCDETLQYMEAHSLEATTLQQIQYQRAEATAVYDEDTNTVTCRNAEGASYNRAIQKQMEGSRLQQHISMEVICPPTELSTAPEHGRSSQSNERTVTEVARRLYEPAKGDEKGPAQYMEQSKGRSSAEAAADADIAPGRLSKPPTELNEERDLQNKASRRRLVRPLLANPTRVSDVDSVLSDIAEDANLDPLRMERVDRNGMQQDIINSNIVRGSG